MNTLPQILLVDDDPDDLMLLRDAIESLEDKFDLLEAKDGRSALNLLRDAGARGALPGLLVLDINMPILDGREVLAIIKSDPVLKDLPVVVFTTSSNPADINYCAQFNVVLLSKPFNITMLKEMARKIVSYCKL
jgi:CheY-like chemotaxis protein